jgi:hypothetical protein
MTFRDTVFAFFQAGAAAKAEMAADFRFACRLAEIAEEDFEFTRRLAEIAEEKQLRADGSQTLDSFLEDMDQRAEWAADTELCGREPPESLPEPEVS